jgi:hypothetical protein
MKNGRKFGLLVAVLLVGVLATPTFAASQRGVTVGDFMKDLANALKLPATDATTAQASLIAAGYSVPRLNLSETLTEGRVAAIASSVGLKVASSNPAANFNQTQVDRFLSSMGSEINHASSRLVAGDDNRVGTDDHSGRGKGKKKPHSKSPKKPKKPHKPKKPQNH